MSGKEASCEEELKGACKGKGLTNEMVSEDLLQLKREGTLSTVELV